MEEDVLSSDNEETNMYIPRADNNNVSDRTVIFGTDISVQELLEVFKDFVKTFTVAEGTGLPYFETVFQELKTEKKNSFSLDAELFMIHDEKTVRLYRILVSYPQEILPILEMVINEEYQRIFPSNPVHISFSVYNLRSKCQMRNLAPDQVDTLISVKGMVLRCSEIVPQMKLAVFKCGFCGNIMERSLFNNRVDEPHICPQCQQKDTFNLLHNESVFVDMQRVKLQEALEEVSEGETPLNLTLHVYGDLVNSVKPGDRVEVSGILRTRGVRINPIQRIISTVFSNYVDALHFEIMRRKKAQVERILTMTERDKHEIFRVIAADPNLYETLAASIAPSLFGMKDMKKGVLCLLFGGSNSAEFQEEIENDMNQDNGLAQKKTRGEINILLCGDPGTAKSQLLSFVHKISPRGIYTSGKGSSAVGLTAYVTKDPETGEAVLESGALVLSDRGICCIDEFDKMSDSTRAILHEVMEQQTISVAKAGIITSLNARTSILASANPIQSKYNPNLSVVNNINLPPTLLSRFDLIFLVLDKVDEVSDRRLASHIVKLFARSSSSDAKSNAKLKISFENFNQNLDAFSEEFEGEKFLDRRLLTEYIQFAKKNVSPKLTKESKSELVESYVGLRKTGAKYGSNNVGRKTVSATTRQLESLIRLSESLAKMHLKRYVSKHHVKEAVRLMQEATQKAAVDPRTGVIDMDAINTGVGFADRKQLEALSDEVQKIVQASSTQMSIFEITKTLRESNQQVPQAAVKQAVDLLQDENILYLDKKTNKVRII